MRYGYVVTGTFLERPNRFVAVCDICGRREKVHVKNTGRCREILIPGTKVVLEESDSPHRSTGFDLIAAYKGDLLINIDSQAPNKVTGEYFCEIAGPCTDIRPEYTFGDSRFDFHAVQDGRELFLEVKGVTQESDETVMFPDAPTERGLKHVRELTGLVQSGNRCVVLFLVQMERAERFVPNYRIHGEFGKALVTASDAGVEVIAYTCKVTEDSMELGVRIPVELERW